jgi:hypothetical protein
MTPGVDGETADGMTLGAVGRIRNAGTALRSDLTPHLHAQLAALPWRAVPDATRATDRGHGRREIRTLKILTISTGIDLPTPLRPCRSAADAAGSTRRNASPPKPSTRSPACAYTKPNPRSWPPGSAATGTSRTRPTGSATSPTTKTDPRSAPAPDHKSWPLSATPPSARYAPPASPTSPPPPATTPATATDHWPYSASHDDFAEALVFGCCRFPKWWTLLRL